MFQPKTIMYHTLPNFWYQFLPSCNITARDDLC